MLKQEELARIYDDLADSTTAYYNAGTRTNNAKNALEVAKLEKTTSGEIHGKNEDERKVKAREVLSKEYARLNSMEEEERACKLSFDLAQQRLDFAKQTMRLEELIQNK